MSRYSNNLLLVANNLKEHLSYLGADDVRHLMKCLEGIPKPSPTIKHDMIMAISYQLNGTCLKELWEKLTDLHQLAVSEALYDSDLQLHEERFHARYGEPASVPSIRSTSMNNPLRFFLYTGSKHSYNAEFIPMDLAEHLRSFVSAPPEVTLKVVEELPDSVDRKKQGSSSLDQEPEFDRAELHSCDMERAAQRDLHKVLNLVDQGRVTVSAKTRRPSAATLKRIAEELVGGDFFEHGCRNSSGQSIGVMRAFAWPMLLQAGKLVQLNGSKLALKKSGRTALRTAAAETLKFLWLEWIDNGVLDEFSRIEEIKGQQSRSRHKKPMTATFDRRIALENALSECPVGKWVHTAEFSRFMRADGYDFEVTNDPWRLYICEIGYGNLGYEDNYGWNILQERYLLCFLFEYAATLGIIDVAYTHPDNARPDFTCMWGTGDMLFLSRYDGLEYIRLTPLGAYCLGLTEDYELQQPEDCTPIRVLPNLDLYAEEPMSDNELLTLENWATKVSDGIWHLDLAKSVTAIEGGQSVDVLRTFLAARNDQSIPVKVEGFLKNAERGVGALKERGRVLLVECCSEEIANRLATEKQTSRLCQPIGKRLLAVKEKSEASFRKVVRELGFGMAQ
ncbi:MAG: hypothetical protein OXE78_08985 [Gammaproteobacteria bacterium]|nr:hypothetical protein [Gammaproteobacteria bacterium]MCY4356310.1 hypothetical protein [Gammaproteobacteria bacterium]